MFLRPEREQNYKFRKFTVVLTYTRMNFIGKNSFTVKPVLSGHSKRRPKTGDQDRLSFNAGQKHCRMLRNTFVYFPLRPCYCIQSNLDYSKCKGSQKSFRIINSSNDRNQEFSDIFGKA